jgi:N-acetylglucosaminyl-diphospho-decaprenol L-rhamnosyltransferase
MSSLDIIIVNWNAKKTLFKCLDSISVNRAIYQIHVVIVDNASSDSSVEMLENHKSELPLTIIKNPENRGFAAACNQGARGSSADYLLFLNPDTILSQDSLTKPLTFLAKSNKASIGIVGIQLLDDSGMVSRTCTRFPMPGRFYVKMFALDRLFPKTFPSHFMTEWDHSESRDVDQVMGAFFLVRRSLFEELSGFDERFFLYFEELDFALRARKAGYRSYYFAEAQAYHKGGGTSEQVKATRLFYSLRSRMLYCYKHFEWTSATGVLLGTLFIEPFSRMVYAAIRLSGREMAETLKGYAMLWKDSLNWFRKITANK